MISFSSLVHPHHVSLLAHPSKIQLLKQQLGDRIGPHFDIDHGESHRGLIAPLFNVCEVKNAYILDGELPGVADKLHIAVEWVDNQVLLVRGVIPPAEVDVDGDPLVDGLDNSLCHAPKHGKAARTVTGLPVVELPKDPESPYPIRLLNERHIGEFQRSFTFPCEVEPDEMNASMAHGLLRIVVPKKAGGATESKRIPVT